MTNAAVNTNGVGSAVYSDSTEKHIAAEFPMPQTILTSKSYVLDYAKPVTSAASDWGQDVSLTKISDDMSVNSTSATGNYGTIVKNENSVTYTPNTMGWDGYDSFFALGKTSNADIKSISANENGNIWTKINVIPANNVYYEDDFVTNTTTGTVGIEYSGDWTIDGTSAGNTESANTEEHGGWQNTDLADDATYTDGAAHVSNTAMATAIFTFTGKGVDVYSRTNMQTGLVKAQLYAGEDVEAAELTKVLTVDNKAASGDYYQIPTVSFADLDHGTYTVKLTVVASKDARSTYYLDGIRVYNPLSEETEGSDIVAGAYGNEIGAVFTEVRDILIEAADADTTDSVKGVVFIDQITNDGGSTTEKVTTSNVGTYVEYGPKNEVYLAEGQAIGFSVDGTNDAKLCVGLKAPEGKNTTASVTNGDGTSALTIGASADLYYEITPNEAGLVVIKNTGKNLLAITKLKTTGDIAVTDVSVMSLLAYTDEFETLPIVEYQTPAEEVVPDTDEDVPDTGNDNTGDNIGDVEIDNPDTDKEQESADSQEQLLNELKSWIKNTFDRLKTWMNK